MADSNDDDLTCIDPDATVVADPDRVAADVRAEQDVPAQDIGAAIPEGATIIKDRFILEERLGKGGMGQVFRARDMRKVEAQDDNPWIAIKFLGDEFSHHPKALISLQREAKKSQQLAHPNVLTVYDFDRDGDRVYMTMELLQGSVLPGWKLINFGEGKTPTPTTLVLEMAAGLTYAHKLGVIHSDFKPDNVYVTVDGRVKILDFGIARIMDTAVEKDSFDAGELGALTLRYASLEMLRGGADPHPADDVYALGLMAYQLFSGEHPYAGKTAIQALEGGLVPHHIKGIKGRHWRAIAGALQLKREDRTASADLFLSQFTGASIRNRYFLAVIGALTLSSAFFAYEATRPEGPAVPFRQLPLAQQQQITGYFDLGQKSASIQDWDGASRYFMAAYDLHPRNAEAEKGLELLADHLVSLADELKLDRQKKYLLEMINAYSENEYLANHPGLVELKARLTEELTP